MQIVKRTGSWNVTPLDRAASAALAKETGLSPLVAHLLIARGVTTPEAARAFLAPTLDTLPDPFLLADMDKGVARIQQARDRNEHVRVFGDFDMDGISATFVMTEGLQRYGISRCSYQLPHRLDDGYGLNPSAIEEAVADGVDLLITVDNGISAHEAAQAARDHGLDLLITDHHQLTETLPPAVAIINPQRDPEDGPFRKLAGAGVAFMVIRALTGECEDLDIVALGTVADIVPLKGVNRSLVVAGLEAMRKKLRPGLCELARVSGINLGAASTESISFQLAPRINAGGRTGSGVPGLELLRARDLSEAAPLAQALEAANEERKEIERAILDQAIEQLEKSFTPEQSSIVLGHADWHPGVIGIVASRLQQRYNRPVALVAFDQNGEGRGSARSRGPLDLAKAFEHCTEHLIRHGGHKAAAGFGIHESEFEFFRNALEAYVAENVPLELMAPELDIDAQVALSQIDERLLNDMLRLEPFGQGNPQPLLCSYGVDALPNSYRVLKEEHLKLAIRQGDGRAFDAIGFRMADTFDPGWLRGPLDIAFLPQFNVWRGTTTIQFVLKDVRPASNES